MTPKAVVYMRQPPAPRAQSKTVRAAADASFGAPEQPPSDWFTRPDWLAPSQKFTVLDSGQVAGYVASWEPVKLTTGETFTPPHSPTKYSRAQQAEVVTDDGTTVRGAVLGQRGHPDDPADYIDPERARAVVVFGEDDYGIWCAGSLLPGATFADVAELRRSSLSGDWRDGDLVGVGLVNVPGSPQGVEHHDVTQPAGATAAKTTTKGAEGPKRGFDVTVKDLAKAEAAARRAGYQAGIDAATTRSAALLDRLRQQVDLLELRAGIDASRLRHDARLAAVWTDPGASWLDQHAANMRAEIDTATDDLALAAIDAAAVLAVLPPRR